MKRRQFLAAGALLSAARIARAQAARVVKFIPQADLSVLDPIQVTAQVTRNHAMLVFDTLYGVDETWQARPQMVEGHVVENDGRTWKLRLREGLTFHDNTPVLARDVVASLQRWGRRDTFGSALMAVTEEIAVLDDRTVQIRLSKPFPLLPDALAKVGPNVAVVMPERLARTDPFTQVTDMVGSGPYRFIAKERVAGSMVVYEKFDGYVPRSSGTPDWNSGPKIANFDRVQWHVIPDQATAAAAMQNGEMDWWENPSADLLPLLRRSRDLRIEIPDPTGIIGCMRLNQLIPPFDNPQIRRVLLRAVNQADFVTAVAGDDPSLQHTPAGLFCPGTPMANDAGIEVLTGPRDYDAARKALIAAGYNGERVVLLAPTDFPILKALADVNADMFKKIGINVDYQAMDWGTVIQRRAKKDPIDKGGWNVFNTFWAGLDQFSPVAHSFMRGLGADGGIIGWPTSAKLEELRNQWLDAPDMGAQKALAEQIQRQAFIDVPYLPLGQVLQPTVYKSSISGVLGGSALFWNVKRG